MIVRAVLPDLDRLDPEALRALILSQHQQLLSQDEQLASRNAEIEHLKLLIAKLQRMQLGRKSEKLERQIEQLQLELDELEGNRAEQAAGSVIAAAATPRPLGMVKAARRPLPAHLPREKRTDPAEAAGLS